MQAWHHHFGFRVAHAAVILNHVWLAINVDEAEEYEATIRYVLFLQTTYGGLYYALTHFLHECVVGKAHWRHRAHSASVESLLVLAHTLVVLGHWQHLVALAVGEHKHGALYARKKLFNQHGV